MRGYKSMKRLSKVKVALVSPQSVYGEDEWQNALKALDYLDEAAATGAQLVCFPEGYPGPCHGPMDSRQRLQSTPIEMLRQKAKEHGVYVSASNLEVNPEIDDTYYLTQKLISPTGDIIANYKRCQPDEPTLNAYLMGGRHHILPGNELTVVPTELGNIGLLICSELWVPELVRIEALKGADIIIAPINGRHDQPKVPFDSIVELERNEPIPGWSCIVRARAAENDVYVVVTANIFLPGGKGQAIVAGPEKFLLISDKRGVATTVLDLERLELVRSRYVDLQGEYYPDAQEVNFCSRTAQIYNRRPDFYHRLVEPQPDAFDYFYFRRDLDSWRKEYEKIAKRKF
jgi:predicted amidohydrolase